MSEEGKSGGSSVLKVLGIGCAVIVLLGVIGVGVLYTYRDSIIRSVSGAAVEVGAKVMFSQLQLSEEEEAAAMVHVQALSDKIKNGEISGEQAGEIFNKIMEGPLPSVVTLRAFELKYVQAGALSEDEKMVAHITVTRFTKGLIDETVSTDTKDEITAIVTETSVDSSGDKSTKLKGSITDEELKECLKLMKDAADKAGIENKEFKVDIADEIRKAIEAGLATVAAGENAQP